LKVLERISMRFSFVFLTLAAGLAVAADRPVTYLEGNVEGLAQNATGTLQFKDSKVMVLHAKGADVVVPYAAVSKTERKTAPVVDNKEPIYKVWAVHKRLLIPTPLQQVTVAFNDKSGAAKSITIEMGKSDADRVQAQIQQVADKMSASQGNWWGDSVWKTNRNKDQWAGSGVVASRE
jgi:hypothetical protein